MAAVLAGSAALLLAFAGTSFADESGDVSISRDDAGASASVSVALIGASGGGVRINASNIQVTKPGCYYIKYTLWVQGGFDQHGKHLYKNFCDSDGTSWQSNDAWASAFGLAPWVEKVTVWVCKAVDGTDPCSDFPIVLKAGGHNDLRPDG
jgi:hypothetical protein